jgi:hypothetical protein
MSWLFDNWSRAGFSESGRLKTLQALRSVVEARALPADATRNALFDTVLTSMRVKDPEICSAGFEAAEALMAQDTLTWSALYISCLYNQPAQTVPALGRITAADWLDPELRDVLGDVVVNYAFIAYCQAIGAEREKMGDAILALAAANEAAETKRIMPIPFQDLLEAVRDDRKAKAAGPAALAL